MTLFTITLVVFLIISSGYVYGNPATQYQEVAGRGHDFKILKPHRFLSNDYHLPSNFNEDEQAFLTSFYHPRKRLIDF